MKMIRTFSLRMQVFCNRIFQTQLAFSIKTTIIRWTPKTECPTSKNQNINHKIFSLKKKFK